VTIGRYGSGRAGIERGFDKGRRVRSWAGLWVATLTGTAFLPVIAHAQIATGAEKNQGAPVSKPKPPASEPATDPQGDAAIIPDKEFEAGLPPVGDDINAPLAPIPTARTPGPAVPVAPAQGTTKQTAATIEEVIAPAAPENPEFAQPLVPLNSFDATPPAESAEVAAKKETIEIRYTVRVVGLDKIGLQDKFEDLSALHDGRGRAANATMVAARAKEDERLAVRLMQSLGYYDATAVSTIEQAPGNNTGLNALITAVPGEVYRLATIKVKSDPVVPADLIDRELALKVGDPIEADRIQGAEANVLLRLGQQGYPFVQVGQRDILLDETNFTGDYTLPIDLGPRAVFGGFTTDGRLAFDVKHVGVFARFKRGQLYDTRKVDDMRQALVATGLFSTVSVEPVKTGQPAPDGTEYVDLRVRQRAGPARTLAGTAGYSTGQGFSLEGSWTHRNLFKPEGALILSGITGTQEQGLSATFRRSNAGRRDRTVSLTASANHNDYDAYEAYTGTISGRISYDSTPIWQKRWTWYYGFELTGTNEDRWNFDTNTRDRGTYFIAAAPGFLGYDTSDNLLNPTRGFRVKANLSPETSVKGAVHPYARAMVEGTAYYPVTDAIVLAGRVRVGSIVGTGRDELPPSRRYYGGGGGSVRGFGFQELGPRSPDDKAVGGRSLNEFAIEARYRFGNYGIVPFIDAGQVYESSMPQFSNIRFGAGIGGRMYTNFGPVRVDVATPINRQPGESKVAVYISIGQAF